MKNKNISIWTKNAERPCFDTQSEDIKTDVLIIGGGIAGVLCAYMLKNAGVDCALVEADRICGGNTQNTTAKITYQHGLIYDKMIKRFGVEYSRKYIEAQFAAMKKYHELCRSVKCDYGQKDSIVYSLKDRERIEREVEALNRLGARAMFCDSTELPISVLGAVRVGKQAQFDPLKFIFSIARELPIYENTKVLELRPDVIITDRGRIKAEKIIVATHFPIINKHGSYFIKMYQHRSYVLALENAQELNGMYVDEDEKGLSFRSHGGLLLLGGGSHRTGKKGGNWRELERFAAMYYKNSREVARWSAQDCMTLDSIPYIGRYSNRTKDIYVATGFNKWGMTSSMAAAMILADLVQGKKNEYAEVFSPSRSILRPQLIVNAFETTVGLLTPTAPRCPHLGCALKYNRQEHSWDCSCHGSRFSENGQLIDGPATDDKRL